MAAKGKVTFDIEKCKGCGLCVAACPVHILTLDETRINKKGYYVSSCTQPEKCIGCASCALMCPDCVITVERY